MDNKNFDNFTNIIVYIIKYFKWIIAGACLLILLSGIFRVESNEVAVVLRFGKLVGVTQQQQIKQPGLHFALPFFIDEVIKVPVKTVQEKNIKTHYSYGATISDDIKSNGYLITGDSNIVFINAKLKYVIDEPIRYALYYKYIDKLIDGVVSGELTSIISSLDIDSVLTSGKSQMSSDLINNTQRILHQLDCGVSVTNIELTEIIPPAEAKEYFEQVNNASVKKETLIQNAKEYREVTILKSEADANNYLQTAKTNQFEKISQAKKEIAEFNGLYQQYTKNESSVINSVFRQRVIKILDKMGTSIIVPDGKSPVIVLP
ncbi:protease modulator HflK [Sedimentibacter sp. zth1]|uniref:protease modulator HflK n=1 Tax=Sedimentibacter sp. zth1 TaxID=2816908 RepID=UPI001A917052|nr:protease modulator HflK [Sedimentibacter sp. zth1]QSX06122.1 protease modulator HflK [Sedimentibacter sp. zth1]